MALALNAPRFDAEPFARVRAQLNAVLKRESTEPDSMAAQAWRRAAWAGHPYSRSARGELGEIDAVTRDDLLDLRRRMLARDSLKIAVVGAIDAATLARHLDQLFAGLPPKAELTPVAEIEIQGLGQRIVVDFDVPQANIRFGRPGLAPPRSRLYRSHGGQSHSRRRRLHLAPVAGGAREARPDLFGLFDARDRRTQPVLHRRDLDQERTRRRNP